MSTPHTFPPSNLITRVQAGSNVEFRSSTSSGVRVVRVFLLEPTPRIIAFCQVFDPTYREIPLSLYLDEVLWYVHKAQELLSTPSTESGAKGSEERGTTNKQGGI